ncbi:MAG: hypothetical protein IIY06_07540 [Proteobacteria bacterium]|nr:hypothetical protein [Pseudomonadota bacterium]
MTKLIDLSDSSAKAEAKRLSLIIMARRDTLDAWIGIPRVEPQPMPAEDSGFHAGMLALFRYARGEAVPAFIVRDFLDDLLKLMFCGLASPSMAVPSFSRMGDRPWAHAWRLAELRLVREEKRDVDSATLAHLLGISLSELAHYLEARGLPNHTVPAEALDDICQSVQAELNIVGH